MNEVNGENLMTFTENIAKEVRHSGSEEELRAFRYVQNQLEGYGIETNLQFHNAYISLPIKANLKVNGNELPCITHSMAPSTPTVGIEGRLSYIGELRRMNVRSPDVKGKIVVLEGIALPSEVKEVEELGAICVVFINGQHTHEMIVSTVWGNPTPNDTYPSIPVISVTESVGEMLKHSTGFQAIVKSEVETGWRRIPVLTADIKGQTDPETFLLVSGHIDSWHYGAMDNASANATMIEVARILKKYEGRLRRSIRIAFWSGHSHGRYAGSTAYCDEHWEELHDNCFLHIYVDSVGGKGANILTETNCMAETRELASSVIESITGEHFIGKRFAKAGDQSFWGTGVPSLYMGMSEQPVSNDAASKALMKIFGGQKAGGFGWWWHTTEDTIDKIDENNLVRDCKVYAATIVEACTSLLLPINHREAIQEMLQVIEGYHEIADGRIDLSLTLHRLKVLYQVTNQLYETIHTSLSEDEIKIINQGLIKLSNRLIPLNYVEGDSFDHDLAEYQPAIPLLAKIADLSNVQVDSDEYYRLKTYLIRKMNKANYIIAEASILVEELVGRCRPFIKENNNAKDG
jgi:hypothetical protein